MNHCQIIAGKGEEMGNQSMLNAMNDEGVIAVLRSSSVEQALQVASACLEGGVHFIEITFSVPGAARAIERLAAETEGRAYIGAGTVTTKEQAVEAIGAGARFVVAPTYNVEVLEACGNAGVPYMPGCMTVNEMNTATLAGCEVVKLFPASEFSPGFIKAVHAPLPGLKIMPTGGINLENTAEWIAKGAFAVGVGGNLTKIGDDGLAGITERAAAYREQVRIGRGSA